MPNRRADPPKVSIQPDHIYYSMSHGGNLLESRLLMATHLGRPQGSDEIVYHKDGDSTNNSIDNLVLVDRKVAYRLSSIRRNLHIIELAQSRISIDMQNLNDFPQM